MKIRILEEKDKCAVESIFDLYWNDDFRIHLQKKLNAYLQGEKIIQEQDFHFFVCEEKGEVLGVSAYRKLPDFMLKYAETKKPGEFYMSAVKERRGGLVHSCGTFV